MELEVNTEHNELMEKFFERVDFDGPLHEETGSKCWLWTGPVNQDGYGKFYKKGGTVRAHRFIWRSYFGEIPKMNGHYGTMLVCHKCDNPPCIRPTHLFLGTQKDNVHDMYDKGRQPDYDNLPRSGENNSRAKLTWEEVREIRRRYAEGGVTMQEIADDYPVEKTAIRKIIKYMSWKE